MPDEKKKKNNKRSMQKNRSCKLNTFYIAMSKLRHEFFRLSFTIMQIMNSRDTLLVCYKTRRATCTRARENQLQTRRAKTRCTRWENAHKRFHSFIPRVSIFNHSHKWFVINSRGNDRSPIRAETWLSPWIVFPILSSSLFLALRSLNC